MRSPKWVLIWMGQPLLLLLFTLFALPTAAQIDPTGEWDNRFHEDEPERIPGPEIGDYLGLPINDAARLRGDTWVATLPVGKIRRNPQLALASDLHPDDAFIPAFDDGRTAEW